MTTLANLPNACAAHSPQRHRPCIPPQHPKRQFAVVRVCNAEVKAHGAEEVWCGLCGHGGGWMPCGRCMGKGGFPTRPGLAGVKGKVGWGRCKSCFGHKVVPCLFCGVSEWKVWAEHARRHPPKQANAP